MNQNLDVKSILVPYDNSTFSDKSLDYALKLARTIFVGNKDKQIIKIVLLHIVEEIPLTKSFFDKPVRNQNGTEVSLSEHAMTIYKEMEGNMQRMIDKKKDEFKSIEGIEIDSVILHGNPANQIVDFSKDNKVDLIIIGSNGLQGISKVFKGLGSVSRKVSERVACPVLIIR